jgi:hypothetical protein
LAPHFIFISRVAVPWRCRLEEKLYALQIKGAEQHLMRQSPEVSPTLLRRPSVSSIADEIRRAGRFKLFPLLMEKTD